MTSPTAGPGKPGFSITTGELAAMLGAELEGAGDVALTGIEPLDQAGPSDLSFVRSKSYASAAAQSGAGALLVSRGITIPGESSRPVLLVDQADRALVAILSAVRAHRFGEPWSGRHPSASIDEGADLHESVTVGAGAVIERAVRIGAGTRVGAGAVVLAGTVIGERCEIGPNVVLGYEGFGYIVDETTGRRTHLPHVGGVRVGNDVEIGAGTCIDRGKLRDTVIGDGCKIDNLVQIGHNCVLGENVVVCGQCGLGGSARVGDRSVLAGQVGIADNTTVGADVVILAKSGVVTDLPDPGHYFGTPAQPRIVTMREAVALRKLARQRLSGSKE